MSWVFGIVGSGITPDITTRIKKFIPPPLYTYHSQNMHIWSGGLKETCLSSLENGGESNKSKGWIVCGIGISPDTDVRKHILTSDDWDRIFQPSKPHLDNLEGHFVAVCWEKNNIVGYVDSRGIRDLYIVSFGKYILFSTRLDWFARCGLRCSIDFSRFGSRWLAFNQLSRKSVIRPIERLGPGARVNVESGHYAIHYPDRLFLPRTDKSLDKIIPLLSTFSSNSGYNIVNCLSGGLDSRVLLSTLLSIPNNQWRICIFGSLHHPDVKIARRIVRDLNLPLIYFDDVIPDEGSIIRRMRDFVTHTQCIAPATDAIRLGHYEKLYQPKNVVIDGAFGEIMRRTYFNRLLIRGRNVLFSGSARKIVPYLKVSRADIFNTDILHTMNTGLEEDVASQWQKSSKTDLVHNTENFLDLLTINTRLPNLFGPEVSRLDYLVLNYMPFAQPSFLWSVLQTDLQMRRNGHFSRTFIKMRENVLTEYPLVKDNTIYPFTLAHPVLIKLWREIRRLFGISFHDTLKIEILKSIEAFIRDTVSSRNTRSFAPYDIGKIDHTINRFYAGEHHYADDLSWWLSFELWRQVCMFS